MTRPPCSVNRPTVIYVSCRKSSETGVYYPFLDAVVRFQFRSESLAGSLARPKFPDDEHVSDGHGDDGQEEENGGDEAIVGGAQRVGHRPLVGRSIKHANLIIAQRHTKHYYAVESSTFSTLTTC